MATVPARLPPDRRRALLEAKLRALARTVWGDGIGFADPLPFGGGAALAGSEQAWMLADGDPERVLGPAVAWARRRGLARASLLVEGDGSALARRASFLRFPVEVWEVEGTALRAAEPGPVPSDALPDPRAEQFRPLIEAAGAEPVVEHGLLRGEVLGLEVARVVVEEGSPRLDIGVGRNDREAHRLVAVGPPTVDDLFGVVRWVVEQRVPGGEGSDAYHLAPERWLRSVAVAHPDLVGASSLAAAPSPARRPHLRVPAPAPAVGAGADGRPVVVVCSAGVDLDLVPMAAEARAAAGDGHRLVLCLPEGDDLPVVRELASELVSPAEVVTVPSDWRAR